MLHTFKQIMWKLFYSKATINDKGTLYQLKHLVHRTAVGSDPKHKTKASEDFLLVVMHALIIAAAKSMPQADENCLTCAKSIVERFVNIKLPPSTDEPSDDVLDEDSDEAYNYATDLLTFCLIWHGFHDSVKEGDGNRIMKYWKFLLPIFQQTGHYNYAKEAFILLAQENFLSQRKVSELKWSRTVNTQGRQGCNIPIDLHLEHLNRRLKSMMGNLHSNTKPSTILRVAKSLNVVEHVCQAFQAETGVAPNKGYSSVPSFENDFQKILKQIQDEKFFFFQPNRSLTGYKNKKFLNNMKWTNITEWIKQKLINLDV